MMPPIPPAGWRRERPVAQRRGEVIVVFRIVAVGVVGDDIGRSGC
jgi:hypothetical protein